MWRTVHAWRYLWEIARELPGSRKQKKQIMSRMAISVREFVYENPNISYNTIVKRFGNPQQIVESYVAEMEAEELLQGMKIRKKFLNMAVAVMTVLILVWFCFHMTAYMDHKKDMAGYAVVEIVDVERHVIDEGGN